MSDSIVPPHLAIKAMRDNGYKNTAYALAELMDNSIQAGANNVELICVERNRALSQRARSRIDSIAILDDGCGMSRAVLKIALQFGNGTRLEEPGTGIGKFGMGLPNSSISQAKRVEVYTWENGIESAIFSYIDVSEVASGEMKIVPEPINKRIPREWQERGNFKNSGTLVIWKELDRVSWMQGQTIIKNSELLIGRMYRYFIHDHKVRIQMKVFQPDISGNNVTFVRDALPNDPMYLMSHTSCPAPFDDRPMFSKGDFEDITFDVRGHNVLVQFSYATEEARKKINGNDAGNLPHGKHASKNSGVSIVRAGRELDLDTSWTDPSDPRDRWWGVEIHFPPALDEIFGVTNNKQHAHKFSELAKIDLDQFIEEHGYSSIHEAEQSLQDDDDSQLHLIRIIKFITNNIKVIRRTLRAQMANTRSTSAQRYDTSSQDSGTAATKARQTLGKFGTSDSGETLPIERRIEEIRESLLQDGISQDDASYLAEQTITRNLKYTIVKQDDASPSFFNVKPKGGAIIVSLNTSHPAYSHLVELVAEMPDEKATSEELSARLRQAKIGLELLILAWARYEDEQPDGPQKEKIQEVRWEWGKIARDFLRV